MNRHPARRITHAAVLCACVALLAGACSNSADSADSGSGEVASGGVDPGDSDPLGSDSELEAATELLDGIVEDTMERTGVPGVAVAVVSDDEVLYTQGYGVRSTETDEPVASDTVFQIASMSKPLSSTVMSGLVDEGVIDWDDPISEHGNPYPLSDPWVTEHVTFADLFSHRSGLPGTAAGNDLEGIGIPRTEVLERLHLVPLNPFRQNFSYSNWAMTLGGEVAAMAAGESWEDLSERILFEPAGMDSTSARYSDFLAAENRAEQHALVDDEWVPEFKRMPDGQAPAGGVSSTVEDLGRWAVLQLANGSLDGEQLIEGESLDVTHTPHITKSQAVGDSPASSYGLGWNASEGSFGLEWSHSGAFSTGAATTVKLLPDSDLGIVVLTNAAPIGAAEEIADRFLDEMVADGNTEDWAALWGERMGGLYGEQSELPGTPGDDPAHELSVYEGTYANDYVGDVTIVARDGSLVALMGPDAKEYPMTPLGADYFMYLDAPETPDYPALAEFTVADGATEASAVILGGFDGAGLGTLERV
ncbi:MAG: serine hydrolase [Microthrixaceae bacterium]|nr:serine hydrolase [Microthrixaceae bacterium]MCO5320304.1 serine hydrolase [Microthrixaceae bacterium]